MKFSLVLLILFCIACNKEEVKTKPVTQSSQVSSSTNKDPLFEEKKDDEGCEVKEEELKIELEPEKIDLSGDDPGCEIEGEADPKKNNHNDKK